MFLSQGEKKQLVDDGIFDNKQGKMFSGELRCYAAEENEIR